MRRLANDYYIFNDLSIEAQYTAMENLRAEEEYWEQVEYEVDNFLRNQAGRDVNFDWSFDGEDIIFYFDIADPYEKEDVEEILEDIKYDAIEMLDGNNEVVDKAIFEKDGTFVGFMR